MAVGDNMTEGFISSWREFRQLGTVLSPEDVAWADSCLSKDPETLDSGWNSMKEALLETLGATHDTSVPENDKFSERLEMEISPSTEASTRGIRHNIALPSYNGVLRDNLGPYVPEVDMFIQEFQSNEDIFKIWDLDINATEEDGLVKELNKALAESSLEPTGSFLDDSDRLMDASVDDLVSGIADLSLRSNLQ